MQTREERLQNILTVAQSRVEEDVRHINYKRHIALGWVLQELASFHKAQGMKSCYVDGDAQALKQNFYVASKLTLASAGHDRGATFEIGVDFLYALLTDNEQIIQDFAKVENPELVRERTNPLWPRFQVHMLQLAILGDESGLREKINKMAKHGKKPLRDECAAGQDFYSLLLDRDQRKLEELIGQKHARIKSHDPTIEGFMSYEGAIEAKLCWRRGIPVQIDSPLVPMMLMPVEPLESYDDVYDFLRPGWKPPQQGFMSKVKRWLGGPSPSND